MARPTTKQLIAFTITWCSYAVTYFLRKPLGVIKPSLETEFKVSRVQLGWMDVALLLPYSLVQISSSSIADRFGPRLTISLCLSIAGTCMFTFGYWDQYWILFLLMLINGAMQGPCWPSCCKSISTWFPSSQLNSVIGLLSTSVFIGGAAGTALAVHLQSLYGWRMVFVFPSLAAIILSVLVFWFLKGSPDDVIGSVNLSKSGASQSSPSMLTLLRIPTVVEITATVLCLKIVRYCIFLWLPMYLVNHLGYTVPSAGLFSTLFDIGGSFGSPMIGFILDSRFSSRPLFGLWLAITVSSVGLALFASCEGVLLAIMLLIAGATNGGADSLLAGSVSMKLGEENGNVGAALTGLINGIATLGAVVEGPMFGWVADNWGWGYMFAGVVLVSFAGSCLIFRAVVLEGKRRKGVGKLGTDLEENQVPLV